MTHADQLATSAGFKRLRDVIIERAAIAQGNRVVDVGAGTGLLTLPAARQAERVWAVDISPNMCGCVRNRAREAGIDNVETVVSSAVDLPMADSSIHVAISNYCFHHLSHDDKLTALHELHRVLVPRGRLVFADMMFSFALGKARNRAIVEAKVRSMLRKGPAGVWRLAKNGYRLATRRWEQPASPEWWREALLTVNFTEVEIEPQAHEGGIVCAVKP